MKTRKTTTRKPAKKTAKTSSVKKRSSSTGTKKRAKYVLIKSNLKGKKVYINGVQQKSIYGEPTAYIFDFDSGEKLAPNGSYPTPLSWLLRIK